MGRRPVTETAYDDALKLFRERPGVHFSEVGKALNLQWRAAKRLWNHGDRGREPLRVVIAQEMERARAVAAQALDEHDRQHAAKLVEAKRLAQETPELAALDRAKADHEELVLTRSWRRISLNTLQGAARLADRYDVLSKKLATATDNPNASAASIVADQERALRALSLGISMAQRSLELERVRLGEATSVIRVEHEETVTVEEAEAEIQRLQEDLARAKGGAPNADDQPLH